MHSLIILATGFLIMFVGSGSRFAFSLTLKPMADEFGQGRGLIGSTVAIYYVVTAVCLFLSGRMIDRYAARDVLAWGLVISAAGIGLIGWASAPWHLVALYGVIFGIGNGIASITPVSILVTRLYPERAGAANGIISAGMSAGQLFMIAALAFVLVGAGWRSIYVWLGLAHLVLLPLLIAIPREDRGAPRRADGGAADGLSLGQAARTKRFWLLLATYAICGLDDFFVSTHVVAFAQDKGIDTLLAGNLLALMGLVAMIGVLWSGVWCDRHGVLFPMLVCFGLRIVAFALILVNQSALSVLIFTLIFGLTFMMTAPLTVIAMRQAFGTRHLGTLCGFAIMIHHMCGGLGAWLGGFAFDTSGSYDRAFAVMLASAVVATWATLALRREGLEARG